MQKKTKQTDKPQINYVIRPALKEKFTKHVKFNYFKDKIIRK